MSPERRVICIGIRSLTGMIAEILVEKEFTCRSHLKWFRLSWLLVSMIHFVPWRRKCKSNHVKFQWKTAIFPCRKSVVYIWVIIMLIISSCLFKSFGVHNIHIYWIRDLKRSPRAVVYKSGSLWVLFVWTVAIDEICHISWPFQRVGYTNNTVVTYCGGRGLHALALYGTDVNSPLVLKVLNSRIWKWVIPCICVLGTT
jgi:hypothetical protein